MIFNSVQNYTERLKRDFIVKQTNTKNYEFLSSL